VEEAVLGLCHSPERVDVDPQELRQHLFGEARLERELHPGECLDVLVGEQLSSIGELGGFHQPSQRVDAHATPARCLLERVNPARAAEPGDIPREECFVSVRANDRRELDPATSQRLHQAGAFDVVWTERV
jgi:hypothetical protein